MTTESKRITNIAIDKNEAIKESFKEKGIPELLSEVNLKIDSELNSLKTFKKFIAAIKRKVKSDLSTYMDKDKLNYFEKIKINNIYTAKLKLYKSEDKDEYNKLVNSLYQCLSEKEQHLTRKADLILVEVTIKSGDLKQKAITLLNKELEAKRHRATIIRNGLLIVDLPTLISEVIAIQSVLSYGLKNKATVKYLFIEYVTNFTLNKISIPSDEIFKEDVLKVIKKHRIAGETVEHLNTRRLKGKVIKENPVDNYQHLFYCDVDFYKKERLLQPLNDHLIRLIIKDFIQESGYIQYRTEEQIKQRSNYAKSFQTKKHIKVLHCDAMTKNVFLKKYGKSELDNNVDLKKFEEITEPDFLKLSKKIFIPYSKDYSFRIKRLGNLKAAGCFYPFHKTTIFDLKHTDSYVHELGHQIDYMLADGLNLKEYFLSETFEFREISNRYKRIVRYQINKLDYNDPDYIEWHSKRKYNASYYFQPTEIFARCYEIYLSQLELNNTLMQTNEELAKSPHYTLDKEFIKFITPFFKKYIKKLKKIYPVPSPPTFKPLKKPMDDEVIDENIKVDFSANREHYLQTVQLELSMF